MGQTLPACEKSSGTRLGLASNYMYQLESRREEVMEKGIEGDEGGREGRYRYTALTRAGVDLSCACTHRVHGCDL